MRTLSISRGNFQGVAYSSDGRFLVSLDSRVQVRFWDLDAFTERLAIRLPPAARCHLPNFQVRGERLVVGGTLWDAAPAWEHLRRPAPGRPPQPLCTRIPLEMLEGEYHNPLAVTPDCETLAGIWWKTTTTRDHVEVWAGQGRSRKRFVMKGACLSPWALSPDGGTLAARGYKAVKLLDLGAEALVAHLPHPDVPGALLYSPDGRQLAVAAGRKVWLWDVASRKPLTSFPAFRRFAESLAFSPDGELLAAGSREGQLRLWDLDACKELACLDGQVGAVHGLAFSPDGMTVAAAGHDNALVIWDVE
jgi:WD40 repeat protein